MTTNRQDHRELDRIARTLHVEAAAHLHPRTRQQLRARRTHAQPAPSRPPRSRALRWSLAGTFAATLAVVAGLGIDGRFSTLSFSTLSGDPPVADTPAATSGEDYGEAYAALDEDPDFYLWLATADVQPLAME